MPQISVTDIPIDQEEMLLVFWHADTGEWWATVGPTETDEVRAYGTAPTAAAAMAGLLIALGVPVARGDA